MRPEPRTPTPTPRSRHRHLFIVWLDATLGALLCILLVATIAVFALVLLRSPPVDAGALRPLSPWSVEDYARCAPGMPIAGRPGVPHDRCCKYGLALYCAPALASPLASPPAGGEPDVPRIES